MNSRGYTLIELLVVMAILGILAALTMPLAEVTVQRERERELKHALWEIRDAIDAYKQAREIGAIPAASGTSLYPTDLPSLTRLYVLAKGPNTGSSIRFLRQIPRDPFAPANLTADKSWGLRSYMSEAEAPKPGVDVFDVYSMSDKIGLNGVPVRQW